MNKKVITIIILTIIALVILALFTFGPFSGSNKTVTQNPISLQPQTTEQVTVSTQEIPFSSYHNKDMKENFYTFKIPDNWHVSAGQTAGSYGLTFSSGTGRIELMDVPDNSTLELFVLSQEEPRLKKSLSEYERLEYKKTSVNENEAYDLQYQNNENGIVKTTITTYIAGPDHAVVTSFSTNQDAFPKSSPLFTIINNSINWENP